MNLEERAFEEFNKWKESLDHDLGDAVEDWEEWWRCFLAGYKAAQNV